MYQVDAIPAFSDNYIWSIRSESNICAIVDPGDSEAVLNYLKENKLTLTDILVTHHHPDHTGGVTALKSIYPQCQVYVPNTNRFMSLGKGVEANDELSILDGYTSVKVINLHGHTRDHIGFYAKTNVFVGDTLFSVGCGRLFEGSPEQMLSSLESLAELPDDTGIYCAHEYTKANIAFAKTVDELNPDLLSYEEQVIALRNKNQPTIPTTIGEQKRVNPFLRCDRPEVQKQVAQRSTIEVVDKATCFKAMRRLKDDF